MWKAFSTSNLNLGLICQKKSLNRFWSQRSIFLSFGCLGWFIGGNHRIWSRGFSRGKGQEPMSSQVRQPCQAPSTSFLWGPEFWVWTLGFRKMRSSAFWRLLQKIRLKSAPKIRTPSWKIRTKIRAKNPPKSAPKSAPKIRTKVRAQSFQPIPTETHNEKGTRVVAWGTRCCYSLISPKRENRTKNPLHDSGRSLMPRLMTCKSSGDYICLFYNFVVLWIGDFCFCCA